MTRPRLWLAVGALALAACGSKFGAANASTDNVSMQSRVAAQASVGFPAFTGRVVDAAGILPGDREAALASRLSGLEARTTDQLAVATVASLNGEPIEDYARRLGNSWGLGQRGKDNGVLILVAPTERKVRIAVGLGLERVLTNAACREIIDRDMLPRFTAGHMAEGIEAGVDSVIAILDRARPKREAA